MSEYEKLFRNQDVEYEFANTENITLCYELLDPASFLDRVSEAPTEEAAEEIVLTALRNHRMLNLKNYRFRTSCPICCEGPLPLSALIDLCHCGHKCCINCWKDVVNSQLNRTFERLHCFECQKLIPDRELIERNLVDQDRWCSYSLGLYRNTHDDLSSCPKCQSYYIFTNPKSAICPVCLYHMCPLCCELEHDSLGMDCQEFTSFMKTQEYLVYANQRNQEWIQRQIDRDDKRLQEERRKQMILEMERKEKERQERLLNEIKENEQWINKNTKRCPRCTSAIEKNKGCNHMTCTHCGYQFCWLCGEKYTSYHFSSTSKCKQFDDGYVD